MSLKNFFVSSAFFTGLLLSVFTSVFFVPKYADACDIRKVQQNFQIRDNNGNQITTVSNTNSQIVLYANFVGYGECENALWNNFRFKHRFRLKFSDGSFKDIDIERNIEFEPERNWQQTVSVPWRVSGLSDFNTKQPVKAGSTISIYSHLTVENQVQDSSPVILKVGNSQVTESGQVVPGQSEFEPTSGVQKASLGGLVPCGRDSGVSPSGTNSVRPSDTCTVNDLFILLIRITNYLIGLGGFFAVFQIVRSAFSMVLTQGNQEAITNAKKHLINAVLGLVLAMMAYLLINTIIGILGLRDASNILQAPIDYITQGF